MHQLHKMDQMSGSLSGSSSDRGVSKAVKDMLLISISMIR